MPESKSHRQKLIDAGKGSWVVYEDPHGEDEEGRIKSWNDKYIYVVYHCGGNWDDFDEYTGVPTSPEDIKLVDDWWLR